MLHPKFKRYVKQIIPFPIIWLLFGLIYCFVEYGLLGSSSSYPSTGNQYNFGDNIRLTAVACIIVGVVQGAIEVLWLRNRLTKKALWIKIALKSLFYISFIIVFLSVLAMLNSLLNSGAGNWTGALEDLGRFITNFAFWSVILYISLALVLALFLSEISQYLGDGMLVNFFLGRYHKPKKEIRIFMFLDMKSSTAIAEELGHEKYFDLLKAYYGDMTLAILETMGQIYQYVGDEIVVSWTKRDGTFQNNCIECFSKIQHAITQRSAFYLKNFGHVPEFKAGYHIGEVTTGEIGIIKKDIIYTGDVLNTTARIQAECNSKKAMALLSGELLKELQQEAPISFIQLDKMKLRGKTEAVQLYSVVF